VQVFIPKFDRVYEDFGEVIGVDTAKPVEVRLKPIVILLFNKILPVEFLGDKLTLSFKFLSMLVKPENLGYFKLETMGKVWWAWLSYRMKDRFPGFSEHKVWIASDHIEPYRGFTYMDAYYAEMYKESVVGARKEEEVLIGSLYYPRFSSFEGPLKEANVGFMDFLKALADELDKFYEYVDLKDAMRAVHDYIPKGVRLATDEKAVENEITETVNTSFEYFESFIEKYVKLYVKITNGEVVKYGLYLSKAYHIYAVLDAAWREYAKNVIMWKNYLDSQVDYYRDQSAMLDAASLAAMSSGNIFTGMSFKTSQIWASMREAELQIQRMRILDEYNEVMRRLATDGLIQVPVPVHKYANPSDFALAVVLFPVVTKVRVSGVRAEGEAVVLLAPDGVGVVPYTYGSTDYTISFAWIYHPEKENYAKCERLVPCAYGDGFVQTEILGEKINVCKVCGVPLCHRHRHIVKRRKFLIKTTEEYYCPLHMPRK